MVRTSTASGRGSTTLGCWIGVRWRSWALFADHHGLDPRNPQDCDLVAYVQARALVGISYASIGATLTAAERVLSDPELVRPVRRHLGNLYADGVFAPPEQAPLLTLGQVMAMAEASADALTRLLVVRTYRTALRPGEWAPVRYPEHVGVSDREVTLVIPRMEGGGGAGWA